MIPNNIEIVFQNSDFVLINKPAGLNFHSEEEISTGIESDIQTTDKSTKTTAAGLVVLVKELLQVSELYPVHRLDKMTSGLVVFALNKTTTQAFQRLFEAHQVQKLYLAISDKKPKKKQGWIIGDMVSARRGSWKLSKDKTNPAKTQFLSFSIEPGLRLYLVKPITGKTHQIRVALKSVGAPILGDSRYADANAAKQVDRGYLHAFAIQFELNGELYQFTKEPNTGESFLKPAVITLCQSWENPWQLF